MSAIRQRNVALILARELAVNVATPMWVWDEDGRLVYYNDHVAALLGLSSDLDVRDIDELEQFQPTDLDGNPIPPSELPSAIATKRREPAHRDLRIVGRDGVARVLTVTAFPLFGRGDTFVGALSVFWQRDPAERSGAGTSSSGEPG
jgi:PAS domain-containing protein